jgi:hypothetical protein
MGWRCVEPMMVVQALVSHVVSGSKHDDLGCRLGGTADGAWVRWKAVGGGAEN